MAFASCQGYRQNILFETEEPLSYDIQAIKDAESNYSLQPGDRVSLEVYSHGGELLIDPAFELEINGNPQTMNLRNKTYLVQQNGYIKLPMIDSVLLENTTLREAENILQTIYNEFYENSFVILRFQNKRAVVLGLENSTLVPLDNENVSLAEALAMAGGLDRDSKAHNIRIIRGSLNNPQIIQIDLSKASDIENRNIRILPGDVIYVEPVRRVFVESVRDYGPVFNLLTSVLTLIIVLNNL